eukprot:TRINITY_DN12893_c0_g2_i1.p1 TRINITY_DN12893_c0_g2~~TRINITY_DN12893_c0_g2_i1.p1  ORF type:complete len:108 (-),score=10.71 TRINITY_DN12893_c0_g2_i1:12-335(-)
MWLTMELVHAITEYNRKEKPWPWLPALSCQSWDSPLPETYQVALPRGTCEGEDRNDADKEEEGDDDVPGQQSFCEASWPLSHLFHHFANFTSRSLSAAGVVNDDVGP